MALRVFTDLEGQEWNVWLVRPVSGDASPLPARYRDGWICFQRTDGTGRCRMPVDQMPPGWESLPDDRLDLLRRVAEQPVHTTEGQVNTPTPVARAEEEESRAGGSSTRRASGRDA